MLGCTHYPFLRKAIRKLLGDSITLIDTSEAVVRQLKRQLEEKAFGPPDNQYGSVIFISSKDEVTLLGMAEELMSSDLSLHVVSATLLSERA